MPINSPDIFDSVGDALVTGNTSEGQVSTAEFASTFDKTYNAGISSLDFGVTPASVSSTYNTKAGNVVGVNTGTDLINFTPLNSGSTIKVEGTLQLTPSGSGLLMAFATIGTGQATGEAFPTYTSVGTDPVDYDFEGTAQTVSFFEATNNFRLQVTLTGNFDIVIKKFKMTITNA